MDYQLFLFSVDDDQCPDFRNILMHQLSTQQQIFQSHFESADHHHQMSQTGAYYKDPEAILVLG